MADDPSKLGIRPIQRRTTSLYGTAARSVEARFVIPNIVQEDAEIDSTLR